MSTQWLIDENQVVHAVYCASKGATTTPYIATRVVRDGAGKPSLDIVHDYKQMSVHLAGPDQQNGISTHSGKPSIHPCPFCVPEDDGS